MRHVPPTVQAILIVEERLSNRVAEGYFPVVDKGYVAKSPPEQISRHIAAKRASAQQQAPVSGSVSGE